MIQQFHFWVQKPEYSLKPQRIESWVSKKYLCTCSSMIHIKQKVDATHMYTDGWTNKQNWSVHTKDHYSALKRKEILTCHSVQFSSIQSLSRVQLFVTPWTVAHQASLSITNSRSLLKLMSIASVMPSNHLILCCSLLLLPSMLPSIRVFSKESVICIRWPKYWSFSFSISPFQWIFSADFL